MNKRLVKTIAMLASMSMLVACTTSVDPPKNEPIPGLEVEETPDPTKPVPETPTDKPETNQGGGEEEIETSPKEIPVTTWAGREIIPNGEEAKESAKISGYDSDGNVIWEYTTEEVYVGQYDNISYPEMTDNGVYFTCGTKLYCIDITSENYGKVKWVNEEDFGTGCSMVFDEEGNVYVMAYEKDGYVIVDKNGNTVKVIDKLDLCFGDKGQEYFWKSLSEYVDGFLLVYFDSNGEIVPIDALSGIRKSPEINMDPLMRDWRFNSKEIEGDLTYASECTEDYDISIDSEGFVSFTYTTPDGSVTELDGMAARTYPGNMYNGIDNSLNGRWYLSCEYDEENSFKISLSEPYYLEVLWYHGVWTEETYPAVVWIKFEDAEVIDYYSDVLAARNQEDEE